MQQPDEEGNVHPGHRDDVHEPGARHCAVERIVIIKVRLIAEHQGLHEYCRIRREYFLHTFAQKTAQPHRYAAQVKACVFNAYGAFRAYFEEYPLGMIIIVALAEKSIGSTELAGKAHIVSRLSIHKSLIGIDYRLEFGESVTVELYLSAAIGTVIYWVGQHVAADQSGLAGMELRLCRGALIIGGVINQPKRKKHKGQRRLTQPHFTRRGKSRTEHRRNNGNGGQPAKG